MVAAVMRTRPTHVSVYGSFSRIALATVFAFPGVALRVETDGGKDRVRRRMRTLPTSSKS